jgi:hypothetical protein
MSLSPIARMHVEHDAAAERFRAASYDYNCALDALATSHVQFRVISAKAIEAGMTGDRSAAEAAEAMVVAAMTTRDQAMVAANAALDARDAAEQDYETLYGRLAAEFRIEKQRGRGR